MDKCHLKNHKIFTNALDIYIRNYNNSNLPQKSMIHQKLAVIYVLWIIKTFY